MQGGEIQIQTATKRSENESLLAHSLVRIVTASTGIYRYNQSTRRHRPSSWVVCFFPSWCINATCPANDCRRCPNENVHFISDYESFIKLSIRALQSARPR